MVGAGLVLEGKAWSWMQLYRDDDSLFHSILTSGEGEGALFDYGWDSTTCSFKLECKIFVQVIPFDSFPCAFEFD